MARTGYGMGVTHHEDGVAIGRRLGDRVGAQRRAGARLVLDHERGAERFRQRFTEDTGDDVGAAAWSIGDHNAHRPGRPFLRPGRRGRECRDNKQQCPLQIKIESHDATSLFCQHQRGAVP